jgi:ABC-type branched-subunit amino acid transport system substrate-binding protein
MKERRVGPRLILLLLILAMVAAGCRGDGGDGGEDGAAGGDTGATEPDTGTTPDEGEGEGGDEGEGDDEGGELIGVTDEPCPNAVNEDNGCIYLGIISDLTEGPFAALAVPITDAQEAFWRRVNEGGGIGGYDIDVTTWVRDNRYSPDVHNQVWQEMRNDVLALAQTLGSPTTLAIIDDLEARNVVAAPANWTSANLFEDVIIESGAPYCIESMNAVDWAIENRGPVEKIMAVHLPGDYGDDGAAGARIAAEENGIEFIDVPTQPGQENQGEAIGRIVAEQPDLVILTLTPTDTAVVVGQAAAQGFQGTFIGNSPTWNPGLLGTAAADALRALYLQAAPWAGFDTDTPGHEAMREALGDVEGNDGYTAGWVWQYPLRAALERASENGDLTREGLLRAVEELESVDYEGMLPEGSGNFAGEPNDAVVRASVIAEVDDESSSGVTVLEDFFTGPTAEAYELTGPCFQQ